MAGRGKEDFAFSESASVSVSAGLLLETGAENSSSHARRLVLVRQAKGGKWGIVAGKLIFQPQNITETAFQTALREMREETGLGAFDLTDWWFLGNIYIPRQTKLSLGFIFEAIVSGKPDRFAEGYVPARAFEIAEVKSFEIEGVLKLLEDTSLIYRPEFNVQLLKYWAFDRICRKYEPWEGWEFAQSVAEARTGYPASVRKIFQNQRL